MTISELPGSAAAAQKLATTCLRDFGPPGPTTDQSSSVRLSVAAEHLPVPTLVRYALLLIGLEDHGRSEKTAWYIPFSYRGRRCAISHEKFGLRLCFATSGEEDRQSGEVYREVIGKLNKAIQILESMVLGRFAEQQVRSGNVTIENQYGSLRGAYEYFREGAYLAHQGEGRLHGRVDGAPEFFQGLVEETERKREGFYNLVAALNSYMSLLEHTLILALPFVGFDPAQEDLNSIVRARWGKKYDRVFVDDPQSRNYRKALVELAETWRNTYSHGGFDKPNATFNFHTPGVGAISAALSNVRDSPHFQFVPVAHHEFEAVISILDEIDAWLRSGPAKHAMKWIESGNHVRFDEEFREELAASIRADNLESLIARYDFDWERNANMDW